MDVLQQFIVRTPVWVWVLFVYLVVRGLKARKAGETTLVKIAIIPILFTAWGLHDLIRIYGATMGAIGLWLAGISVGAVGGWLIASRMQITADRAAGTLHRPADTTLLPLILFTFGIKYCFGAIAAMSPELLLQTGYRVADLALSGLFTGVFVGKFFRYLSIWQAGAAPYPSS